MVAVRFGKALITAGWDDVPHLSEDAKARMLASTPPHLREARSKGIPSLGSGAIYPIPLQDILVDPFPRPPYWRRAYGFDVGWNCTAAVWGAEDPDTHTIYLYAEHKKGEAEPTVHAAAVRARGDWIPGAIDPASRGRQQSDGRQLLVEYDNLGLHLYPAENAVEAGIYRVWTMLSLGQIKVFRSMSSWQAEYWRYRRDEKGKVVKTDDHLMDATRYLVAMFDRIAKPVPVQRGRSVPHIGDPIAGY